MCDEFEFMMYGSWYEEVEDLKRSIRKMQLYIPVMHCEKHVGEGISKGTKDELEEAYKRFEINCDIAPNIGAEKLVIHLWDGLTSDANFQNNLNAYYYLNEKAIKYGLNLLVENVVCNQENPMKHWCELKNRYPNIHFVFDTKMAAFHEQMDLLYKPEYEWLWKEKHICHYHVNDSYKNGQEELEKIVH